VFSLTTDYSIALCTPKSNMMDPSKMERGQGSPEKPHQTPSMGAGKTIPPPLPNSNQYVVDFDGPDDPIHPLNWALGIK
jgi:DHA1 family multidrug resistance protein-like MFS transporter